MWRFWRITIRILALVIVGLSLFQLWQRRNPSTLYLLLGEQYTDFDYTSQYYVFSSEGKPLFKIKDATYGGDWAYFDLIWTPDARGFFKHDAETSRTTLISLHGDEKFTIAGLSYSGYYDGSFAISPDQQEMAYMTPPLSATEFGSGLLLAIRIIDFEGRVQHIIELPDLNTYFVPPLFWSPDQKWLYVRVCMWDYWEDTRTECGLYRVQSDGTHWQQVTYFDLLGNDALEYSWSPDGKHLAFITGNQLWLETPVDDGYSYTHYPTQEAEPSYPLLWSPDGEWIIYQETANSIQRIRFDGSDPTDVIKEMNNSITLQFIDPDGWIYFMHDQDENGYRRDFYRVSADRGEPALILERAQESRNTPPQLTPDGWLIALQTQEDNSVHYYRMKPDGSERFLLADTPAYDPVFAIDPMGEWLLVGGIDYSPEVSEEVRIADGQKRRYPKPDQHVYQSIYMNPSPPYSMPYQPIFSGFIAGVIFVASWAKK